ncbi:MAG: hypothetical protein FWF02_01865 [Micrococcales bacterium]|nr:hypothetical protein [Micrococcales bacterium]MCL2666437.1 hypothetical protein [Micrococcales bacterium]
MRPLEVVAVLIIVALLVLWVVWLRASRLDRLHRKVVSARAVVAAQLVRRGTVAAELATSGLLDPVSSVVLGESAWQALAVSTTASTAAPDTPAVLGESEWRQLGVSTTTVPGAPAGLVAPAAQVTPGPAESELTAALTEMLSDEAEVDRLAADPLGAELLDQLAAAWYRVQLARRIHNEAVAQALRVRRGWMVRTFHLAGSAVEPTTLELDDSMPMTMSERHG